MSGTSYSTHLWKEVWPPKLMPKGYGKRPKNSSASQAKFRLNIYVRGNAQMTSALGGGRGSANFWPKEGRLREFGTDKGEGGGQKSRKFGWRHLWTAPNGKPSWLRPNWAGLFTITNPESLDYYQGLKKQTNNRSVIRIIRNQSTVKARRVRRTIWKNLLPRSSLNCILKGPVVRHIIRDTRNSGKTTSIKHVIHHK